MNTLSFAYPHNDLAIGSLADTGVDAWKVTLRHGVLSGVGASVSGSGAWAKVHGDMSFTITSLEQSQTYQEMKSKYDIKGGVSGFFGWHPPEYHFPSTGNSAAQRADQVAGSNGAPSAGQRRR